MTFTFPPNRIRPLIDTLEQGNPITPDQLQRTLDLQHLDIADIGYNFAKEMVERDQHADNAEPV